MAHEAGRRAVKFVRKGQLGEAVECHLKAAKILHDLEATLEKESGCKRSVEEQAQFHERQAQLAQVLRELYESKNCKREKIMADKNAERKRIFRPLTENSRPTNPMDPLNQHPSDIFRQIDEVDSLLQILSNSKTPTVVGYRDLQRTESAEEAARALEFTIRPRNDAEVIEELQMVNSNLRALVDKLLTELNESREENKELRRKLVKYEGGEEENDTTSNSSANNNKRGRQNTTTTTALIKKEEEILTLTKAGDASLDFHISLHREPIPELDPLEDPDFNEEDFTRN
ncbi:uncharacterized protein LOC110856799 isoform X2 [Folsomia candida]|uniref:uncharacterized protein LOC110856799 isoform X2 n=1 Tax=Folsomia candida TaxID=158441 RepID=UPI001604FE9C|nr:uncharacterized protein LOC110856799 isoform X2 [Folsomia candida]